MSGSPGIAGAKSAPSRLRSLLGISSIQGLGYLSTFAWTFWGARDLGPARFGVLSLAVAWALVLRQLLEFGHGQALTRFVPVFLDEGSPRAARTLVRRALLIAAVAALALAAISGIAAKAGSRLPWFGEDGDGVLWVPLAAAGAALASIAAGAWKGTEQASLGSFFSNTALPASLVVCVLWLPAHVPVGVGLVLSYGFVGVIALISLLSWWRRIGGTRVTKPTSSTAHETTSFAARAMLIGFVYMGISLTDRLMLGELATLEETGIYTLASRVAYALLIPVYVLVPLVSPVYARIHTGRRVEALQFYSRTTAWSVAVVLPVAALVATSAGEVLGTLGGAEYAKGANALVFLVLGFGVLAAVGTNGTLLQMGGQERTELNLSAFTLGTNLLLNLWLIPRAGALGAAIATASSLFVSTACKSMIVGRVWRTAPWGRGWIPVLLGTVALLATHLVLSVADWGTWWMRAAASAVPYAIVLWLGRGAVIGRSAPLAANSGGAV